MTSSAWSQAKEGNPCSGSVSGLDEQESAKPLVGICKTSKMLSSSISDSVSEAAHDPSSFAGESLGGLGLGDPLDVGLLHLRLLLLKQATFEAVGVIYIEAGPLGAETGGIATFLGGSLGCPNPHPGEGEQLGRYGTNPPYPP